MAAQRFDQLCGAICCARLAVLVRTAPLVTGERIAFFRGFCSRTLPLSGWARDHGSSNVFLFDTAVGGWEAVSGISRICRTELAKCLGDSGGAFAGVAYHFLLGNVAVGVWSSARPVLGRAGLAIHSPPLFALLALSC